jgi:DNA-binding MarR family transcriptional regulator
MLIDRLARAGWVRRCPHPTDRRSVLLELTKRAEEEVPPGLVMYHENIRSLARGVPAAHREALCAFLESAAEAASTASKNLGR